MCVPWSIKCSQISPVGVLEELLKISMKEKESFKYTPDTDNTNPSRKVVNLCKNILSDLTQPPLPDWTWWNHSQQAYRVKEVPGIPLSHIKRPASRGVRRESSKFIIKFKSI